jgi:hypothetical protein
MSKKSGKYWFLSSLFDANIHFLQAEALKTRRRPARYLFAFNQRLSEQLLYQLQHAILNSYLLLQ